MAFIAREPFDQSGASPLKFKIQYEAIRIINTGSEDLLFELSPFFKYKLAPKEVFDEQVDPFNTLIVTPPNSMYKGFVREELA